MLELLRAVRLPFRVRHCGQRFIIQIQRFGLGCIFFTLAGLAHQAARAQMVASEVAGHAPEQAWQFNTNDPASLLYSALWHQEGNQVNAALRDLKQSGELNDHRSAFRSQLLPDQDAAVRGANLADIYHDAGMDDVSLREATRAVNFNYADYSAHLFLADSYNPLHNPNLIDPREATAWSGEFLVANLLAPVGAGTLSQSAPRQEYARLFQHDDFGIASSTSYSSRGDWTQAGSQYGTVGNFGYAVDTFYNSANGWQPNNGQEQLTVSTQLKWDFTPRDSVYLQAVYYDASGGDLNQYYNPQNADASLHTSETQAPLLLLGYRHEWSPGVETLAVAGRFDDTLNSTTVAEPVLLLARTGDGTVIAVPTPALPTAAFSYQNTLEIYSAEVQQIWQKENYGLVFGSRAQFGTFDTQSTLGAGTPTRLASTTQTTFVSFTTPPNQQNVSPDFERLTGYGYGSWQVFDPLQLEAGLSCDYLKSPANYLSAPVSGGEQSENRVSPKAGFTWTLLRDTTVRFAYTRSLGGVSVEQNDRLEPSQVAGFDQAFSAFMPAALAGSPSGAKVETFGLALEQNFPTGTYLAIEGQILDSTANQTLGAVTLLPPYIPPAYAASSTLQELDYTGKNFILTANQLVGDCWSLGARYELSLADLAMSYPEIPASVSSAGYAKNTATLNQFTLSAVFNHPSGLFARAESSWYSQSNDGYNPAVPGDHFWEVNLFCGYRFWHRRMAAQLGVLNLNDTDYHLNPLNQYAELPRQRTFTVNFQFTF